MSNKFVILLGVVFIIAGVVCLYYQKTVTLTQGYGLYQTTQTTNPYSQYGIPLIIGGIVLEIVGAMMNANHDD